MTFARQARGFTLIEVVVALAILSMVLLGAVTGIRTLGNTQVTLEQVTRRVEEVRGVSEFLRDLLESSIVGSGTGGLSLGGGARETTYFHLGPGFVEWKTNLLFGEAYGGTYVVRIAHEGDQLMLRWLESRPGPVEEEEWRNAPSRPLVDELEEFAIAMRPEFDADWVEQWDDTLVAPALVSMRIKASGRYWPDLIMQVQR